MTAQTPNPFPTDGQRKLSTQELYERMQAHACMATAPSAKPSCEGQVFVGLRKPARFLAPLTLACAWLLLACQPQDSTIAVPYGAVNHTDIGIASIVINGQGGVLNSSRHGSGNAGICCVVVPRQWHPGLTVTIQWREDGHWLRDGKGQFKLDADGDKQFIEGPWKSRTVPIPRYEGDGRFFVFFFPGDDVRAALTSSPEWKAWDKPTPEDLAYDTSH